MLISAQTGSGKNTFVLNHLVPYAIGNGKNVLLLCNRVALEVQQKLNVIEKLKELDMPVPQISEEELKDRYNFGYVSVMSYHSCISKIRATLNRYDYIIFDEAHFFISDCLFNSSSYYILQSLVQETSRAVHIYMTATPGEVADLLFRIEGEEYSYKRDPSFNKLLIPGQNERIFDGRYLTVYKFPYDFSMYNIAFFQDYSKIIDKMEGEDSEKWLVFVRRKTDGQKLKKLIGAQNCRYLDSTRKTNTNQAWTETMKGIISKKALICTNVIDNGVSITEPQLKNIVISSINQTEVFQMIGRKRLSQGETVNLFFYVPSLKEISQMLDHTTRLLKIVKSYTQQPDDFLHRNWHNLTDDVRKLFYVDAKDGLHLNKFAATKLELQFKFLTDLKADMEEYGPGAYRAKVRSWLNHPAEIDENEIFRKCIIDILQAECVEEEHIELFYKEIMSFYNQLPAPKIRQGKGRSLATINRALQNLEVPYRISKCNKKWWIHKQENTSGITEIN